MVSGLFLVPVVGILSKFASVVKRRSVAGAVNSIQIACAHEEAAFTLLVIVVKRRSVMQDIITNYAFASVHLIFKYMFVALKDLSQETHGFAR